MTSLPRACVFKCLLTLILRWYPLTAQSTGSHRGIGGWIQIPETKLQALLAFPALSPECPGELARRLACLMICTLKCPLICFCIKHLQLSQLSKMPTSDNLKPGDFIFGATQCPSSTQPLPSNSSYTKYPHIIVPEPESLFGWFVKWQKSTYWPFWVLTVNYCSINMMFTRQNSGEPSLPCRHSYWAFSCIPSPWTSAEMSGYSATTPTTALRRRLSNHNGFWNQNILK